MCAPETVTRQLVSCIAFCNFCHSWLRYYVRINVVGIYFSVLFLCESNAHCSCHSQVWSCAARRLLAFMPKPCNATFVMSGFTWTVHKLIQRSFTSLNSKDPVDMKFVGDGCLPHFYSSAASDLPLPTTPTDRVPTVYPDSETSTIAAIKGWKKQRQRRAGPRSQSTAALTTGAPVTGLSQPIQKLTLMWSCHLSHQGKGSCRTPTSPHRIKARIPSLTTSERGCGRFRQLK